MRKVKLQVQMSVDGYIAGLNGEMDWMVWDWDTALKDYVSALTEPVDTIILGRKLAEGFIPYWESAATSETIIEGAEKLNSTPKIVFTRTITQNPWKNTTLAHSLDSLNDLKNSPGGDIMAYGGAAFVAALLRDGLIDDLHLFVNPVVLGSGMAIFNEITAFQKLKLITARPFSCGITVLHYTKA